jgi:ketosteroid isomerase-like protein
MSEVELRDDDASGGARSTLPTDDERIAALKGVFDAFSRGGDTAVLDLLDPDCELQHHPAVDSATYRGHEGAVQWAVKYWEAFGSARVETSEFVLVPDGRIIARYDARAQGKRSGAEVAMTGYGLFTFRHGKVFRAESFLTRGEALAAAGL